MFVHVVLDEDNIGDYIGGPIKIGKYTDEWGDESDSDVYTFSSPAWNICHALVSELFFPQYHTISTITGG